jgi:hypothetical protein
LESLSEDARGTGKCQRRIAERYIRAARALGWLSDEDAEAAIKLGEERNLAVHMYRDQVGQQIEAHLAAHAALLRRWLAALRQRAAAEG